MIETLVMAKHTFEHKSLLVSMFDKNTNKKIFSNEYDRLPFYSYEVIPSIENVIESDNNIEVVDRLCIDNTYNI